jgi:undecaprenyl-diphosphatase
MFDIVQSIVIGVVQGLIEWLPLSSEGTVSMILVNFFNYQLKDAVTYALWLHVGTLFSALFYFRKDIPVILKEYKFHPNSIFWFLLIASFFSFIVAAPIYFFGLDKIDVSIATFFIGGLLIFTGIMQLAVRHKGEKPKKTNIIDAFIVGPLQGLAIMPGVSRSGITTSTLLMRKYNSETAFRLSFLMSMPVIAAMSVYLAVTSTAAVFNIGSMVAVLVSFIVGILSINVLLKLVRRYNFGTVCIVFGALVILAKFI